MQTSNVPNLWKPRGGNVEHAASARASYTAEQKLFLQRLSDLADKRRQFEGQLERDDWHQRLIDKALYSTYIDCLNLELRDEARRILEQGERLAA